jgi:hypothetical protein
MKSSVLQRYILFSALFVLIVWFVSTYIIKENMTDTEIAIKDLKEEVEELKADFDNQEARMGGAATEAAQKQALLHSNVSEHTTSS